MQLHCHCTGGCGKGRNLRLSKLGGSKSTEGGRVRTEGGTPSGAETGGNREKVEVASLLRGTQALEFRQVQTKQ